MRCHDLNLPLAEIITREDRHATIVAGRDGFVLGHRADGTSCMLNGSWTRRAGGALAHNLFKQLTQRMN